MNYIELRLFFDTSLFVLIWTVQLVIYPSFLFYQRKDLVRWHKKYTKRISFIVMPLMLGQLGVALYQFLQNTDIFNRVYFALVVCSWLITFLIFVPRHSKIATGTYDEVMLKKMVLYNWLRTGIWTLILIGSIYEFMIQIN